MTFQQLNGELLDPESGRRFMRSTTRQVVAKSSQCRSGDRVTSAAQIKNVCGVLSGLLGLLALFLVKMDVQRNVVDVVLYASFGFAMPAIAILFVDLFRQYR